MTKPRGIGRGNGKKASGHPSAALIDQTEAVDRFIGFIRNGNLKETSANASGISRRTIQDWVRRGGKALLAIEKGEDVSDNDRDYADFVMRYQEAQALAEIDDLRIIQAASQNPRHWQAAAWRLERRSPDKWGRRIVVAGDEKHPLVKQVLTMTREERSERIAELLRAGRITIASGDGETGDSGGSLGASSNGHGRRKAQ